MKFIDLPNLFLKFGFYSSIKNKYFMKEYGKIAIVALIVVIVYEKWLKTMLTSKKA